MRTDSAIIDDLVAASRILARAHPGWVELWSRLRGVLDPERRMNPGRW